MEFNKERCITNIYALAKEQGVKIGELESAANISTGYLSRLAKETNTAIPNIEALLIISDMLNVSLDALIKKDLTLESSTEGYLLKVVNKLLEDTKNKPRIWIMESKKELEDMTYKQVERHPLFTVGILGYKNLSEDEAESHYARIEVGEEAFETHYEGVIPTESSATINGDFFYADVSQYAGFYLTSVIYPDGKKAYELFLREEKKIEPLCTTYQAGIALTEKMEFLYKTVVEIFDKPKMKKSVRNTLDQYIDGVFDILH